eukprot:TRINITY_DN5911_c0_g1_i7.p1 TRINITY_DN5911_c0_g1~~TRINITY_DN5911_c0_g1_i7.p1  ORF type:complete len:335 (-),score=114.42 TRINITY_DN5911_c0_g1_i7:126-1016(-)
MDVQPFIQCAYFALKQINSSKKFKALLRIVLKIGNYMNGGTQRGGAYGFTFQSIEKLKDTKSTNNKYSLIHYLYFQLEKEENKYLQDWYSELPQIALATKVSMDLIRPRLGTLTKGVRDLTVMLRDYTTLNGDDQFETIMKPFLDDCTERTKFVEKDFERMEREYKEFLNLWLIEESQMPLETAFILMDNFINDYLRAGKEIIAEREAEEKKRRIEEKKALAEAEKATKKSEAQEKANNPTTVEDMTAQIRSGAAFEQRRAKAAKDAGTIPAEEGSHLPTTASTSGEVGGEGEGEG